MLLAVLLILQVCGLIVWKLMITKVQKTSLSYDTWNHTIFLFPLKSETMGVFDLRNGMSIFFSLIFFWFVEWNELISHCIAHKLIISINMRCHPTKIHGMDSWCSTILDEVIPQTKHPRHGEGYLKFAACSFCTHGSRL